MPAGPDAEVVTKDARDNDPRSWSSVDSRRRRSKSVADDGMGIGSIVRVGGGWMSPVQNVLVTIESSFLHSVSRGHVWITRSEQE